MSKAREFPRASKVKYQVDVGKQGAYSEWLAKWPHTIHLIEKSAYDKAVAILRVVNERHKEHGNNRFGCSNGIAKVVRDTLKDLGELDDKED